MEEGSRDNTGKGFGPIFSRFYSFFASRSGRSIRKFRIIAEDVAALKPGKVLDMGCGPGILMEILSEELPDSHIYGADPSQSMVSIAKKRLSRKISQNKVSVIQGDSLKIDFNEKFDVIVTTSSFHHWDDKEGSLNYLSTLLNEKGSIMIYENLGKHDMSDDEKMHHSLSVTEAEKMEVKGLRKTIRVRDDIISVKLTS